LLQNKAMFILGLTGSLGMGKSATAKMFAAEGVPVHDADAAVHDLYDGVATPQIEAAFPGTTAGGKVDRGKLGQRVLGDATAMKRLEHIVHPLVRQAEERFLAKAEASGATVAVLDIPLLYETGGDKRCEEKFNAILAKQTPDAEKRARADFLVDTSRGFDAARAQVRDILKAVAKMAKRTS
jgi:dephospho-CoA kinase